MSNGFSFKTIDSIVEHDIIERVLNKVHATGVSF